MSAGSKWTPPHWRRGCWVAEHTRTDGAKVRGHWRAGAQVRGHYCIQPLMPTGPRPGQNRLEEQERRRTKTPVIIPATANHAAVAEALGRTGHWAPARKGGTATARAELVAVLWRQGALRGNEYRNGTEATIPETADQVTLDIALTKDALPHARYRIDTEVFVNGDGTVAMTAACQKTPEQVARLAERYGNEKLDRAGVANRRNQFRERLGRRDPEQAVALALRDILDAVPLPALPLTKEVAVADREGRYLVTVRPLAANEEADQAMSIMGRT